MRFWSGPPPNPPPPPPLETHFFEVLREKGGVKNVQKMIPFFGSKIMNLLVFSILSRKVFPGPDSMGFVWGGVGRALQFMHSPDVLAMLAVLATPVTPWYPL